MDKDLRQREREVTGNTLEQVRWLRESLRSGLASSKRLEFLASLGDPVAVAVLAQDGGASGDSDVFSQRDYRELCAAINTHHEALLFVALALCESCVAAFERAGHRVPGLVQQTFAVFEQDAVNAAYLLGLRLGLNYEWPEFHVGERRLSIYGDALQAVELLAKAVVSCLQGFLGMGIGVDPASVNVLECLPSAADLLCVHPMGGRVPARDLIFSLLRDFVVAGPLSFPEIEGSALDSGDTLRADRFDPPALECGRDLTAAASVPGFSSLVVAAHIGVREAIDALGGDRTPGIVMVDGGGVVAKGHYRLAVNCLVAYDARWARSIDYSEHSVTLPLIEHALVLAKQQWADVIERRPTVSELLAASPETQAAWSRLHDAAESECELLDAEDARGSSHDDLKLVCELLVVRARFGLGLPVAYPLFAVMLRIPRLYPSDDAAFRDLGKALPRVLEQLEMSEAIPTAVLFEVLNDETANLVRPYGAMMRIGRGEDCALRLETPEVSRAHAGTLVEADELILQDLNSAGGTYVNGVKVTRAKLCNGDLIAIGNHQIRVRMQSDPSGSERQGVSQSG